MVVRRSPQFVGVAARSEENMRAARMFVVAAFLVGGGCGGPKKPGTLQENPVDFPTSWEGHQLFNTEVAYIYAANEASAGMAEKVAKDVAKYIKKHHDRALPKGLVIVMEPQDQPFAETLEQVESIQADPDLPATKRRHPKTPAELRSELTAKGIPEAPMVRAGSIPLSARLLRERGLRLPPLPWAVAMPSRELAVESGTDVFSAAMHHQKPEISVIRAREAASKMPDMAAKAFEVNRGQPIFVLWASEQSDWSEDQRREAILAYVRAILKKNSLPVPKDEALGW